jgi:hypothetical protein
MVKDVARSNAIGVTTALWEHLPIWGIHLDQTVRTSSAAGVPRIRTREEARRGRTSSRSPERSGGYRLLHG